jgi:two-component system KDP operon response regulator KdpE
VLDPVRHEVQKSGERVHLTPHEFDALKLLMSSAGRPVISDRAYLRVLIGQLRKKLGDDSNSPTYIETDGYIGYRFRDS